MIGLGTIVNVGTVLIGTTIGILLKNGLPKRFEKTVMQGLGLSTCFIGIGGTLSEVLTIQDGEIGTQHTMLLILCLALGAVIGEALNIEQRLEDFGAFCQSHFAAKGDSRFVEGFVTASLLFCVGAVIVGALNDGLSGINHADCQAFWMVLPRFSSPHLSARVYTCLLCRFSSIKAALH
ncbi:MAG: DUF554 family protein [Butyricicoccus sp.]